MLEIISNMDWVLKVTIGLWLVHWLISAGLGALIAGFFLIIGQWLPVITSIVGIVTLILYWISLIVRYVFTIWSVFILLSYLF